MDTSFIKVVTKKNFSFLTLVLAIASFMLGPYIYLIIIRETYINFDKPKWHKMGQRWHTDDYSEHLREFNTFLFPNF